MGLCPALMVKMDKKVGLEKDQEQLGEERGMTGWRGGNACWGQPSET